MIWLLLSCTAPPEVDDSQSPDTGAVLPGVERPDLEPVWSIAELEEELTWLLAEGFPNSRQAMGLYLDLMSHGDAICPGNEEYIDATNLRGCTADSGYFYSGVSTYERQTISDPSGNTVQFEGSTGDYLFRDPLGKEMEGGGHQTLAIVRNAQGRVENVSADQSGTFVWAGHDGIYREKVSGSLRVIAFRQEQGAMRLEGATGYLGHALYFDTDLWEDCGWRTTSGIMEVRDPSGGWYTLGPQSCESDCMRASFAGQDRGEICVSLAPIAQAFEPELALLAEESP